MAIELLDRLLGPLAQDGGLASYPPDHDYWYQPRGIASGTGAMVTPESAMRVSTVFACVKVIAETMGSVNWQVFRRLGDGRKERAPGHPLYRLLHDAPNPEMTAVEFKEMEAGHVALRGNSYARIRPGARGPVSSLWPLHPDRVRKDRLPDGSRRYRVRDDASGREEVLLADEVYHVMGPSADGLTGVSVLEAARESIGLAIAQQQYGARSFGNGVRPSGVLKHPGALKEESARNLRRQFDSEFGGFANSGKTIMLEEGMEWQQVGMTSEDAQFLDTFKFTVPELARFFRMPLIMIQEQEKSTSWGTGVEQQQIGFVMFTMLPYFTKFEQKANKDLVVGDGFFSEFLTESLLRGDIKSRFEAYNMAINGGWMNRSEVRIRENLNPGPPELEQFLQPGNMNPAGSFPASAKPAGQQALLASPSAAAASDPRARLLAREAAGRIVRKEQAAIEKAARRYADDGPGWEKWLGEFYREVAEELTEHMYVEPEAAQRYAGRHRDDIMFAGARISEAWGDEAAGELTELLLTN